MKDGRIAGREVAIVISNGDIASIAKGPAPATGVPRVETLEGGDYVRIWIARGGNHYLINLVAGRCPTRSGADRHALASLASLKP